MKDYSDLEHIRNDIIDIDRNGRILWYKQKTIRWIEKYVRIMPEFISEICPGFKPEDFDSDEDINYYIDFNGVREIAVLTTAYLGKERHRIILGYPKINKHDVVQLTLDNVDEIVIVATVTGVALLVNKNAEKAMNDILGFGVEELIGSSIKEKVLPYISDNAEPIISIAMRKKERVEKVIHYNKNLVILYTAVPVFQKGLPTHIILTGRNVSELVNLQEQLESSRRLNEEYHRELQIRDDCMEEGIIYSSKEMEFVLQLAKRAAGSDASVFITGESGTGKEVIAKFIHQHSQRKNAPFMAVNCAAIPQELMESEFFGYADGAFTGGRKGGAKGILEESSGGTVFLDEIGELPAAMQSKLLRVIQDGKVYPVGASKCVDVDVRYISATNLPAEKLQNDSFFRQDLYYRLCVIPLNIPPLRKRKEDIIPLLEYFLAFYNKKHGRKVVLSSAALELLYRNNWSGNVRQLKNFVERIVVLANYEYVLGEDIKRLLNMEIENRDKNQNIIVKNLVGLNEAHEMLDSQLINMAIERCGSVPKAAKALGVPPSTIYRKLKPQNP